MEIRDIISTDFDAVCELMAQVHKLHFEHRPDIYRENYSLPREYFADEMCGKNALTFVAEENGEVIGLCFMMFKESSSPVSVPRKIGYIDSICVDDKYRGQGVGTLLMDEARVRAKAAGCDSLQLCVWAFNEVALEFYYAQGMDIQRYIMEEKL